MGALVATRFGIVETRLVQLGGDAHRRVEPTHHSVCSVERHGRFHHALADAGERGRDADRVEFSDELHRLNAEQRLRALRCDEPGDVCEASQRTPLAAPAPAPELPGDTAEIVRTIEHRYEVTHRSTTGRLIDMLM